jgi:protein-S-isoprenylcysteine O-methyltransferase Ste14
VASWSKIAQRIRVPLGFVLAVVYVWLARPSWAAMAAGLVFIAAGLWLRGLAAGHVRKNMELTTSGPYAYTRNPLYLGSVLIAAGFGVASRSLWVALVLVALLLFIYLPVIRAEERYLRSQFSGFDDYAGRVPRLFPRLRGAEGGPAAFSRERYMRHREYNASIGAAAMLLALAVKILWSSRNLTP